MNDFIELSRVLGIIKRRLWLLVLLVVICATAGYAASRLQKSVYQATSTVMVGQILTAPELDRQNILASDLVAVTYKEMIRRQPVLQGVVNSLSLNQSWQKLKKQVSVDIIEGTQLIQITVEASSPERAQQIADEVARQLLLFNPGADGDAQNEDTRQFVQQQLVNLQARIESAQGKLANLQSEMVTSTSTVQLSELQTEASSLENLITNWENNYTQLLVFLKSGQLPNKLTIIEPAQANVNPIRPQKELFVLVGIGVGILLGLSLVFVLDYLDDTLRTSDEITNVFGLPVIGLISNTRVHIDRKHGAYVSRWPSSPLAEAYHWLRANLDLIDAETPLKSIMVTSSERGVGKSSISANLAVTLAQSEKKAVLLDADLRKASLHSLLGLHNALGLSDLISSNIELTEVMQPYYGAKVNVITVGKPPEVISGLLGSKKIDRILSTIGENADVIIVDSPPISVSDALLLSSKVDGVLLVVRSGHTKKKDFQATVEQLNRTGARIIGVVINRISGKDNHFYQGSSWSEGFRRFLSRPKTTMT